MKIGVIGTGYVGLVTAACFADLGHKVIAMDKDKGKIKGLKKGILPIYEPGLKELVQENVKKKRLVFTDLIKEATQTSEFIFIAVNTPSNERGEVDVTYVKEAALSIAKNLNGYKVIVNKSTVPVGMADLVASLIQEHQKTKHLFDVVSNPEFLREGSAVDDFMNPDRILIGAQDAGVGQKVAELFRPLKTRILITDQRSAEMIKYASNAFLATKISFINEIANLCEKVGADVMKVAEGMGMDKRIGASFLQAGAGYGGSCFPKDISALQQIAEKEGYEFLILKAVSKANEHQKRIMISKVKEAIRTLEGKLIGVLGLSFKPNTDDLRQAVALTVIPALQEKGARVKVYDPVAMPKAKAIFKGVKFCRSAYETAEQCDCLMILTEWNEFKELDLSKVRGLMRQPIIIDGRNIYDPAKMKAMGFFYKGVGR